MDLLNKKFILHNFEHDISLIAEAIEFYLHGFFKKEKTLKEALESKSKIKINDLKQHCTHVSRKSLFWNSPILSFVS